MENSNPGKKHPSKYLGDKAKNLLKWDRFHVVKEDFSAEPLSPEAGAIRKGLIFEACSMYVLKISETKPNSKYMEVAVVADAHDDDIPPFGCLVHIHKDEPVLIKQHKDFEDRAFEVVDFVSNAQESFPNDLKLEQLVDAVFNELRLDGGTFYELSDDEDDDFDMGIWDEDSLDD